MKFIVKEYLQNIVNNCTNKKEATKKLNISRDTFNKYCKLLKVNINHFNPLLNNSLRSVYIIKQCKKCNKPFKIKRFLKKRLFCSHSCANSSHIRTNESKEKFSLSRKELISKRGPWGFIKQFSIKNHINKICPICNKLFDVYKSRKNQIYCNKICYLLDNKCKYRRVSLGGIRQGSSHGKKGYYNNFWCDSTYELAFYIYCLDHDLKIKRNKEKFLYVWENKNYYYYPDFIVEDILIEIKGYNTKQFQSKLLGVTKPIIILYEKDLKNVFNYVLLKYNIKISNIYKLYDKYV